MVFKEKPNFEPELGQMLLSNNVYYSEEAYWAHEGLVMLDRVIKESKILEWQNKRDYEGKVFAYRDYCWCDAGLDEDTTHPHYNGCPPNFEHYSSGTIITWYKHNGRGLTANVQELTGMQWFDIIAECVQEIKNYEFK